MTDDRKTRETGDGLADAPPMDGSGAEGAGATPGDAPGDAPGGAARGDAPGGPRGDAPERADEDVGQRERWQAELTALNDRYLRLAAEFDNYRKRVERERAEQHARSQADLARRLLDALDDLQRVEHFDPATVTSQSLLQALELVEKKFRTALEAAGLTEIPAKGEFFNPQTMEALMTAPAEHPEEDEVVADVLQKGYRMGNTLVRPARVSVKKYEG